MAGRPRLEGSHATGTSFKLRPELLDIVKTGKLLLAQHLKREHPKHWAHSPNYALWYRMLIDFAFDHSTIVSLEAQKAAMAAVTQPVEKPILVSVKIPEEIRVKLRKIECFVQALDWTIDFNRNATLNFIVLAYADQFNQSLE